MRGYLSIVPVALRGSTTLYMRRDSGDRVDWSLSGSRVQGTGRGTGVVNSLAYDSPHGNDERGDPRSVWVASMPQPTSDGVATLPPSGHSRVRDAHEGPRPRSACGLDDVGSVLR